MVSHMQIQVDFILNRLRNGEPRREILKAYRERWSHECDRTIDNKIAEAKEMLAKERAVLNDVQATELQQAAAKDEIRSAIEKQKCVQRLIDKAIEDLEGARKIQERALLYTTIARLVDLLNRMQGDYINRIDTTVQVNTTPRIKYFEKVDALLKANAEATHPEAKPAE